MQSIWGPMKAHGRNSLLANFHKWKIEKAKAKLSTLPLKKAAVRLDFKSLSMVSKVKEHTLYLNPADEGLSAQLYAWRLREPLNTYYLSRFISYEGKKIDAVLDIGSNIGYFPLVEILSGAPKVIAIEPVPETYFFLKENLKRFKNARSLNIAISNKKEKVKMHVPARRNLATVLTNDDYLKLAGKSIKEVVDVQALPVESIIQTENLAGMNILIRMDIEGFEKNIINKLPTEIFGLSFEFHSPILGYNCANALVKKMTKQGYKIRLMVRELGGLIPIARFMGIRNTLRLYESLVETRVFYEPSTEVIRNTIKQQKESPHIFATKEF